MERDWLSPKNPGMRANIALGTMNFGKRTTEADAMHIMHRALERGVDWFDTANGYAGGASEEIVGRFLKDHPDQAYVATKVGIGPNMAAPEGLSAPVVKASIERSLQRLQIEHIDLFYLHAPDRSTPIQETLAVLAEAHKEGKIGAWGVSNFASWRIAETIQACGVEIPRPRVSQVLYNLLIRQLDLEYLDYAQHIGIHTTVFNALAGGLLAGSDRPMPGGRFENNPVYQRRYLSDRMKELAEAFGKLAADAGTDRILLSYAWLSNRAGVDSVLLGPATVQQLDVGIAGCDRPIDDDLAKKIDEIYLAFVGTDASYAR